MGLSWKVAENEYTIIAASEGVVKHELYHILKGHLKKGNLPERGFEGYALYFLYYEPTATLAGLGIIE